MGDGEDLIANILKTLRGSNTMKVSNTFLQIIQKSSHLFKILYLVPTIFLLNQVKSLRKLILLSMQIDEDDKDAKKRYKKAIQSLESQEKLSLNSDGIVKLSKSESKKKKKKRKSDDDDDDEKAKKKKAKKEKKKSKKEKEEDDGDQDEDDTNNDAAPQNEDEDDDDADKNKPCKGNPQGVTRLFLGNLPFAVDETSLASFLPGKVTHIKWITDKETGRFYGSAFIEMKNSKDAGAAVAKDGQELMNRPIKINFAPAREGDKWPPRDKIITGGKSGKNTTGATAGGLGVKALGDKPEGCCKLFIGNLSYDIDDEGIFKFFANVDAEVKAVRWLHHRDSGDFKGVGFVEFWNEEACSKAATLNGKNLLGRPIRIDWTD